MAELAEDGLRVGFVGLGVMGKAMARNLVAAGFPLTVFNRSRAAVDELAALGAAAAASPAGVAAASNVVMLCLPDTPDVESVLFGDDGIADAAAAGTVVVDASTISAAATRSFAARLPERHVDLVDSPVSGGPKGAQEATLSCMIGGSADAVTKVMPVLRAIGKTHVHLGPAGAGQLVKACNQLVIAATLSGVSEAISLCEKAGIDPYRMREVLLGGSARSAVLEQHAKRLLDGTLEPGFRSALLLKDLTLALEAGRALGAFMPATALSAQLVMAACNTGRDRLDSASLGLVHRDLSGVAP